MASLDSFLPSDGSAVWRRDRKPEFASDSHAVRHIVIRGTEVVSEPSPHVVSSRNLVLFCFSLTIIDLTEYFRLHRREGLPHRRAYRTLSLVHLQKI